MIDIDLVNEVAVEAGKKILEIYHNALNVRIKDDNTPVTDADFASNDIICNYLQKYYSNIQIISEESNIAEYETRKDWEYYFCIDPLDGTKEFIKKSGQFAVNIALIKNSKPIAGVIYAPALSISYFVGEDNIVYRKLNSQVKEKIITKQREKDLVLIKSNSDNRQLSKYLDLPISKEIMLGSSLKFCKIAEGEANVYLRFGTTMEWDTAAGQAIVEATGGSVIAADEDKHKLLYNKKSMINPDFICLGGIAKKISFS